MEDNMNLNANTTDVVENMDDEIIADDISEKLNDNIGADSVDTELTDTLEEDTLTDSNDVKFGEPLAENLSKEEETEETTLMPEEQIVTPIEPPKRETLPNEIGLVSNINGNEINIKVTSSLFMEKNLIDSYVVFGTDASRMVGIVTSVNSELATVRLIGELNNEKFIPGIELKPMINSVCFLTTTEEMKQILASDQNNKVIKKTLLGTMPLYNNTPVYVSTILQFLVTLVVVNLVELQDYYKMYFLMTIRLQEMLVCLYLMRMVSMRVLYRYKIVRFSLKDILLMLKTKSLI